MASCPTCELYRMSREPRIRAEIAKSTTSKRQAEAKWRRFMAGVHERHTTLTLGRVAAFMAVARELMTEED